jgi:hypothetical protein
VRWEAEPCLTTPDNCVGRDTPLARSASGSSRPTTRMTWPVFICITQLVSFGRPYPVFRNVPLQAVPRHTLGLLEGRAPNQISLSRWMLCSTASL